MDLTITCKVTCPWWDMWTGCAGHEFREGNRSPGAGILAFAQSCEAPLPARKRIDFRSDSAAYQAKVINHYRQPGQSFSITADLHGAVKREMGNLPETAWQPYRTAEGLATDREIAETVHSMNGTEQAFRLIVLRWSNPQPNLFEADRYCYHAVATNRQEAASVVIWKHHQRGESENWHKELKVGFGMEQMPCGQFEANAVYFAIGVLAYNLAQLLKRRVLPVAYRTVTVATCAGRCIGWRASWCGTRAAGGCRLRPTWRNGAYYNPHGSAARRCEPERRRRVRYSC